MVTSRSWASSCSTRRTPASARRDSPKRPTAARSLNLTTETSTDALRAVSRRRRPRAAADRGPGGGARQAHRARRPGRQAPDGRGQPAPGGLDRQALPTRRPGLPGPGPRGHDRPRAGGREVRLPQGLQVLDLRHLVDPPGRHARGRRQGPHHPAARARRREAQQDHPRGARARLRARSRADGRRDRRGGLPARGGDRVDPASRPGADLAREADRR